jgi:hypothetical protein
MSDEIDYEALADEAEMGYDNTGDPIAKKLLATTDAQVWAEAFKGQFGDASPDVYTMLTWFANAIETGRNAGSADQRAALGEIRGACAAASRILSPHTGEEPGQVPR